MSSVRQDGISLSVKALFGLLSLMKCAFVLEAKVLNRFNQFLFDKTLK